MKRRQVLGMLAGAPAVLTAQRKPPRNVVFVLTDDQRWDAMSSMGHPYLETPNMDRIAREGARFANAFVTTPLCSPSRGCFLTGQYARRHGIRDNADMSAESHRLVTWPALLHQAGYETGYVGKWHMGTDDSARPGFDFWASFRGQGRYTNPEINLRGQRQEVQGYMTDILTEQAVGFLRRPRSKPFALYLAHKACHGPFEPAPRHKDLYAGARIPQAPSAGAGGPNDATILNQTRTLKAVDEGLGEVLKALEETRQLDNTLVIFASDNGYFWREHGLGDKRWAYDESIRIPLLMRCPDLVKPGTVLSQFALNIDIAPTVLALAGVTAPKIMQGESLLPMLAKPKTRGRDAIITEYFVDRQIPKVPAWESIRTRGWKYVNYPTDPSMNQLFDLEADRYEMKNLAAEAGARGTATKLRSRLDAAVKALG